MIVATICFIKRRVGKTTLPVSFVAADPPLSSIPPEVLSAREFARACHTSMPRPPSLNRNHNRRNPMRTKKCSCHLMLGMTHDEVNAATEKTSPDVVCALERWVDVKERATERYDSPGHYAVEVCWEQEDQITCRTYRVRARTDEDAASKGCAIARKHAPAPATHIEVMDLQPLWRINTTREEP